MPTWTKEVVDLSVAGDALTIDNIKIDGSNIGHTDDTDLLTLASNQLTVAGGAVINGAVTGVTTLAASSNVTIGGTLVNTGLITATAGVKLGNNIIYASDGGTAITLDTSDNVTITGDLTITGGNITNAITMDSNLTVAGNLTVTRKYLGACSGT